MYFNYSLQAVLFFGLTLAIVKVKSFDSSVVFGLANLEFGFETCHQIIVYDDTILPEIEDATRQRVFEVQTRPSVKIKHSKENTQRTLTIFSTLNSTWLARKLTCQVIYMLDLPSTEYCNTKEWVTWLLSCIPGDVNTPCYGQYTYHIWVTEFNRKSYISTWQQLKSCPPANGSHVNVAPMFHLLPTFEVQLGRPDNKDRRVAIITKLADPCQQGVTRVTTLVSTDTLFKKSATQATLREFLADEIWSALVTSRACFMRINFMTEMDDTVGGMTFTGSGQPYKPYFPGMTVTPYYGHIMDPPISVLNNGSSSVKSIRFNSKSYPAVNVWFRFKTTHLSVWPSLFPTFARSKLNIVGYTNFYCLNTISFNFITCSGWHTYLSFQEYIEPFSWDLWALAVPGFILSTIFLAIVVRIYCLKDDYIFFVLKSVLEQDLNLSNRLRSKWGLDLFLSLFLLMCMILSNLYRGELTTNLTRPLPLTKLKTINESISKGYKILIPLQNTGKSRVYRPVPESFGTEENKWTYLVDVVRHRNPFVEAIYYKLGNFDVNALRYPIHVQKRFPRMLESVTPIPALTPSSPNSSNMSFVSELLKCNDTIFVGQRHELGEVFLDLVKKRSMNPTNNFNVDDLYYGEDNYLESSRFWAIGPFVFDRKGLLHQRLQTMIHSGLFDRIRDGPGTEMDKFFRRQSSHRSRSKGTGVEQLNLRSGLLLAAFTIYAVSTLFSLSWLFYEWFKTWYSLSQIDVGSF